jgi:hypothetical protein
MRTKYISTFVGALFVAAFALAPITAYGQDSQDQYPQQPPPPGQYPQSPSQPPQAGQYPQQPPPPQGQYPQQGQYPPPQAPPAQGQYPQQGQYPPAQGQYPQGQYPSGQYPPAQGQYAPPMMAPQQLDQLVQPIALYPDGLLAQVLTASTYSNEIPDAAAWADQHRYLHGDELARAIQEDNLPWDASVLALLPFPQVLDYMAHYMGWTQALGNAVLAQRPDVMDAVQRMRQEAYNYGYLRSNQ